MLQQVHAESKAFEVVDEWSRCIHHHCQKPQANQSIAVLLLHYFVGIAQRTVSTQKTANWFLHGKCVYKAAMKTLPHTQIVFVFTIPQTNSVSSQDPKQSQCPLLYR